MVCYYYIIIYVYNQVLKIKFVDIDVRAAGNLS